MPEIIEGYKAPPQAATPAADKMPDSSWVDGMRRDLRREMIRELALRRIKSGGRDYQPSTPSPSRSARMVEAFFVGVAVTLASSWLCSLASRRSRDE